MQTIPKARPVPVARRSVNDSSFNPQMGQTVLPDNPRNVEDSNRQAHAMHNAHIKAAIKTPEEERRRFQMSSPSPSIYGSHFPPKSSPVVRPQSAMGLSSPPGNNSYTNNYNAYNSKVQQQRPPSSLGIRDVQRSNQEKVTMHHHSRSFGDGITSDQVFTDRLPPRDIANDAYSALPPKHYQDQMKRNQMLDQNKSPQPTRVNHSVPRGSYNPYYASNLDLNSRPDSHVDKAAPDHNPYADGQNLGGRNTSKSSTPVTSSYDLRSAWQRLYGQGADSPGRRPSIDHAIQTNQSNRTDEGNCQKSPRQENRSPRYGADNMQSPSLRTIPRSKQVAGPMVTPFTNSGRQSPPGQCSTNQNHPQGIGMSIEQPVSFSSPKPVVKAFRPNHHDSQSLGPSAKYPDPDMGLRKAIRFDEHPTHHQSNVFAKSNDLHVHSGQENQAKYPHKDFGESRETGVYHHVPHFTQNDAYCSDTESEPDTGILPTDSIFDYAKSDSDEDSVIQLSKGRSGSHPILDPSLQGAEKGNNMVHIKEAVKIGERRPELKTNHYARSRSLEDVRESGDESNVSFDIENTFLMVEPSDQSEMGTLKSKNSDVKTKLNRLEGMYAKVMKTLETRGPKESRGRRWSIGSSDTNSIRHQVHHSKHARSNAQRTSSREIKSVNKRFQRLESHVITLARSIAHISSELRTQTTMSREIENVKREIQDLKISRNSSGGNEKKRQDFDKYRGYNHPLTNPRQVNKLTRFFGQEPSWLEIFLTRLGYEQYVKNFHQEHIGMMELPYMTDDQLKSIGIPMGPRTRILQESQMCFKDDNFNIYIV